MRKFWVILGIIFVIVLAVAVGCAVSDSFKLWFSDGMLYVFGVGWIFINDKWIIISANPIYQQFHMLIWFIGGIIGTVIFTKILWPKRPKLLQKTTTASSLAEKISLQHEPAEPEQAPITKTEEAPQAEA
jgi:hypothetical protein